MSRFVELLCSRRVPHVAALALISIGFAGCSADMSTRLSQNPFSNPFASQPEATGSGPAPGTGRGRGRAPHATPAHPSETTGSVAPRSVAATRGAGRGGTTIIVGTSDTLDTLAHRDNGKPAAAL